MILVSFLAILLFAWNNKFVQDETFIPFRYAENFVDGNGLVFNLGEKVENYPSILWILTLSISEKLDLNPVHFSYGLGLFLLLANLIVFYLLSYIYLKSRIFSLFAMIILGFNYTFSSHATGGSEAILLSLFFLLAIYYFKKIDENSKDPGLLLNLSFTFLLLFLTRMDSVILFFPIIVMVSYRIIKVNKLKVSLILLATFLVPFVLGVLTYLFWKWNYYGDIPPSFYYVKLLHKPDIADGFKYTIKFILSYFAVPILTLPFMLIINRSKLKIKLDFFNASLIFILILWFWYVIKLGGGTKEYSLMMPIIPIIILLLAGLIKNRVGLNAFIFISSIFILSSFAHKKFMYEWGSLKSVKYLKDEISAPNHDLISAGINLNYYFGEYGISLRTNHYGVIGYYSKAHTYDKNLISEGGVNFKEPITNLELFTDQLIKNEEFSTLEDGRNLIIPVNTAYSLRAKYLKESEKIDELILDGTFKYLE